MKMFCCLTNTLIFAISVLTFCDLFCRELQKIALFDFIINDNNYNVITLMISRADEWQEKQALLLIVAT